MQENTLKEAVNRLFDQQLSKWELARTNYESLKSVKERILSVAGREYKVQFNPARIISASAKVDDQSIKARKCFLCGENRPKEQDEIPFNGIYSILVNPYPIFPRHLTIPTIEHVPQRIASRFGDMLDLALHLDDYIVFYNGPKCGASAPDHFHFQAGNKGFLPIEKNHDRFNMIRLESEQKSQLIDEFHRIYDDLKHKTEDDEPMMNILTWFEYPRHIVCVFPRKKHRPSCFFAEGDARMLINPASVEVGGVFVTPLEKDFNKISSRDIDEILHEI